MSPKDHGVRDGSGSATAIVKAGAVLGELGATVEEVLLPLTVHSGTITATLINTESAMTYGNWIRELFISARTVGGHISNILNKTSTANRTEAASYATRKGLA